MSVSLVTEHLESRGTVFEVVAHDTTYTSIDEARALGISAGEVVKTIVVCTESGYVLTAVPGYRRLDMHLVQDAVGDKHARLATEQELARDFADYELGAVPPLGSLVGVPIYADPEVTAHDRVVFASAQTESVQMGTEDLFRDQPVTIVPLTRPSETSEHEALPK